VELDVEIIVGGLVVFEEKRLVILVYDEEVIQADFLLCLHTQL